MERGVAQVAYVWAVVMVVFLCSHPDWRPGVADCSWWRLRLDRRS